MYAGWVNLTKPLCFTVDGVLSPGECSGLDRAHRGVGADARAGGPGGGPGGRSGTRNNTRVIVR